MTRQSRHIALARVLAACAGVAWAGAALAAGPRVLSYQKAAHEIGRRVFIATGSAMPPKIVPLLRETAMSRDGRTDAYYMATFAGSDNFSKESQDKWHPNLLFVNGSARDAATHAKEGRATVYRDSLYGHAKAIARGSLPIDTVVTLVSPPDKEGNVSLGTTSDLTKVAIDRILKTGRGKIIAVVNPNVPHLAGNRIPYHALHAVVHDNDLLLEAVSNLAHPAELAIAAHIKALVPSDSRVTLQIGIGNALVDVASALKDHPKRWFAEMASDQVLHHLGEGPATFAFLHGTNEGYQLAAAQGRVRMGTSLWVNNPRVIASHARPVSINTALQIDEDGNVNAEQIGARAIGGIGGQLDFMKGASMAKDGMAILALRSEALLQGNSISTVVPKLEGPTTTPKEFVDYVVTEWGATARLRGLAPQARSAEIYKVAHPLFRGELAKSGFERGKITKEQLEAIEASVVPSILKAPPDVRATVAEEAFRKGLLSKEENDQIQFDAVMASLDAPAQ